MYQIHLVCQRQCTVSQFSIVEGDEVSQADVLRMYRRTMSATMDGRAIKAPRFSAPMVRCSTSRNSHATGGTTSTAQRHRRTIGIHTFPSSVNYGLLFLLHFILILYSFFFFPLVFIFLYFPFSYFFLFTSFSLSIAFTCSFLHSTLLLLLLLSPSSLSLSHTLLCLIIQSIYSPFSPVPSPFLFVLLILFSMFFLFV